MAMFTDGPPWGSMDPSQAEASVSGTVQPSCGHGPLGFIRGLKKHWCAVENSL